MFKKVFNESDSPMQNSLVRQVAALAAMANVRTYLVGGYIRDLLWRDHDSDTPVGNPKDLDFAVSGGLAFDFAKRIAEEMTAHFVPLDVDFDTARVVLQDGSFLDFAGCQGGTIESDVVRRDFTINALAFDTAQPDSVFDLVGAVEDIEKRSIRAISKQVLIDDPLRVLRAFRFKAALKGVIETQTLQWISETAAGISRVASERINVEMFTLLNSSDAASVVKELGDVGLLEAIYPELCATRRVTPNAFHHLGLFEHSVETVKQLEEKLDSLPDWVRESYRDELSYGVTRLAATKLAALLHDIGKPDTWEINEDGRHCFYGHDNLGAEMSDKMAERLKWSKPVSRFISKLIKWHLRPGALFHQGPPTPKAVQRFYRKGGSDVPELMMLAFGDLGATCGAGLPEESRKNLAENLFNLLLGYKTFVEEVKSRPRFLDGQDVMKLLQIKPGPEVGEILDALSEAQDLREVLDRPSAERFAVSFYQKKYSS